MTDKEKIEAIMQMKGMNNGQFSNLIGVTPGSLSHILSGRTKPTLPILRSIKFCFPEINPAWLFYDEEPMLLADVETHESDVVSGSSSDDGINTLSKASNGYTEGGTLPFVFQTEDFLPQNGSEMANTTRTQVVNTHKSSMSGAQNAYGSTASPVDISNVVSETIKQYKAPARKIVEVRIFFDDGTYETFSGN